MEHVHVYYSCPCPCRCCMSICMLHAHVLVRAACPCPCPCCLSVSGTACLFPCYICPSSICMSMSMLHVHVHAASSCPCCMFMSMYILHLHVNVQAACPYPCSCHLCVCVCVYMSVCMSVCVRMCVLVYKCQTVWHSISPVPEWKKLTIPGLDRCQTKPTQSGTFLVRYWTEITDAGMPMPALVSSMPMPNYVHRWYHGFQFYTYCTASKHSVPVR